MFGKSLTRKSLSYGNNQKLRFASTIAESITTPFLPTPLYDSSIMSETETLRLQSFFA